jgi:Fic family protein
MQPGKFKTDPNRAGSTIFALPAEVEGTLEEGWNIIQQLKDPLSKAMMVHYVVAGAHPFRDGNGRIARLMMNAQLETAKLGRCMIFTSMRDDYVTALRVLGRDENPVPFVRTLVRAHEQTHSINYDDIDQSIRELQAQHLFDERGEIIDLGALLETQNPPGSSTRCGFFDSSKMKKPCRQQLGPKRHCPIHGDRPA